jgi:heme/copper-type cytochrome/quinol oxidase subunit 2
MDTYDQPLPPSGRGAIIAIAIFIVLLIVGVLVYFFWWKSKEDAKAAKTPSTPTPTPTPSTATPSAATPSTATPSTATRYTYIKTANKRGSSTVDVDYNCYGATNARAVGPSGGRPGFRCQFDTERDAQKYCNETSTCAGYSSWRAWSGFQIVPTNLMSITSDNQWDWYQRTTSS